MERARILAWSAEMRRVHQRLADALVIVRESIEAGDPALPSLDPLTYCWAFCAAPDGHHEGEDKALFPRLVEQHPELAEVVGHLSRDHQMIGHLLGESRHSMAAGESSVAIAAASGRPRCGHDDALPVRGEAAARRVGRTGPG